VTGREDPPHGLGAVEGDLEGSDAAGSLLVVVDEDDVERAADPALRRARRRLLGEMLRPHRGPLAAASVCVVVSTAAVVSLPYLVGRGIDSGVASHDTAALAVVLGLFAVAAAVDAVTQRLAQLLVGDVAERSIYDLRLRLWRHLQSLSIDWFEHQKTGRVISRATTDVDAVYELFSQAALTVVSALLTMATIAVVLVVLDPVLGAVVLLVIPVLIGASWLFKQRSERAYRAVRERIAVVLVRFSETLTGIRVIQASSREGRNEAQFSRANREHLAANAETVRLMSVYGPSVEMLGQLGVVLVVLVGGYLAADGAMSVGTLATFLLYVRQFFDPLQQLSEFFNSWQKANSGLEKIAGVLEADSSVPEPVAGVGLAPPPPRHGVTPAAGAEVRLERVTFAYRREAVLHEVDLVVAPGETLALVGATGAGKSTIAKLVARFYDPTAGRVLVDGHDLREVRTSSLRAAVAIVPQEAFLFSGTVHDNIALGRPGVTRADVEAAARAVGAHPFIDALPSGYDTDVDRRGARLSGGQRQLISFARAWVGNPRVLILDEATSALDLRSERLIQRALSELLADRTAIVIAHRLSSIEVADRVAVVEGGRIVELGTPAELLAVDSRFRELHERWMASTTGGPSRTEPEVQAGPTTAPPGGVIV